MKHCHKVKGVQVITFQWAQQLKTKDNNVVPVQLFCRQRKAKFVLQTDSQYWWSRWISVCDRYWQWIHWISNTKEAYKVQVDYLKDSESDSYDKNTSKVKVNDLIRLHEAIQEKLKTASYWEQIQFLTLVPDKWSRMCCSEYFNVFEYLVWTSHEIKKVVGILAKPAPKKKRKLSSLKHFIL